MDLQREWFTIANFNIGTLDVSSHLRANASALWLYKEFLLGNITGPDVGPTGLPPVSSKWEMVGSGDGVTGAMDGVDRLCPGAFDTTKLVVGNNGVAHSWCVLQSKNTFLGGPLKLLLSWTNIFNASMAGWVTKDAFTGGTATNNPVAGIALGGARPFNVIDAYYQPVTLLTAGIRGHYTVDTNGHHRFLISRAGVGYDSHVGIAEVTPDRPSTDLNPWVFSWGTGVESGNTDQPYWSLLNNIWHQLPVVRPVAQNIDIIDRAGWPPDAAGGLQLERARYAWGFNRGVTNAVFNPQEWGYKGYAIDAWYGPTPSPNLAAPASGDIQAISYGSGLWFPFTLLPNIG